MLIFLKYLGFLRTKHNYFSRLQRENCVFYVVTIRYVQLSFRIFITVLNILLFSSFRRQLVSYLYSNQRVLFLLKSYISFAVILIDSVQCHDNISFLQIIPTALERSNTAETVKLQLQLFSRFSIYIRTLCAPFPVENIASYSNIPFNRRQQILGLVKFFVCYSSTLRIDYFSYKFLMYTLK